LSGIPFTFPSHRLDSQKYRFTSITLPGRKAMNDSFSTSIIHPRSFKYEYKHFLPLKQYFSQSHAVAKGSENRHKKKGKRLSVK